MQGSGEVGICTDDWWATSCGHRPRGSHIVCGSASSAVSRHLLFRALLAARVERCDSSRRDARRSVQREALGMTHLVNIVSDGVLIYASVTRGGLAVARGLAYLTGKTG